MTTESRLTALELATTQIEGILNVARFMSPRLSLEEWQKAKAESATLPSGDRNVYDRMREIGIAIDACVQLVTDFATANANLQAKVSALEAQTSGNVQVPVSGDVAAIRAYLESIGVDFAPNGTISGLKVITQGAPEGDYFGYFGVNDGALRIFAGIRAAIGKLWSEKIESNPKLPITMFAFERDRGISLDSDDPANPKKNKTFIMFLWGFVRGIGPRENVGKHIDIGSFEAARGMRWFTRRTGSTTPDIDVALQFDADNANAVALRVDGQLRRLTVGSDGRPSFGEVVDESL